MPTKKPCKETGLELLHEDDLYPNDAVVAGTEWIDRHISPLDSLLLLAEELPNTTPMLLGRLKGVEHRYVLHEGDAYMTAWLRHFLANDADAAAALASDNPEILNNPRWQNVNIHI